MEHITLKMINRVLIGLGFVLTALFGYGHLIDGDVIQNINKAHLFVTQNILTPFGNITGSGSTGNVPGGFLTLAAGLPMKIWFSPWSALIFLAFLHYLSLLMYQNVLKNFAPAFMQTVLIIFFWLNPWRLSEVFLWNPGYIYFATMLHMWSAYHLSKRPSFWFSFLHGQSLFLGLQIHPSFAILVFITFMLLWMRALKPHLGGTVFGIFFGFLLLTPYFIMGLRDPSLFPQPGSGDGKGFLFYGLIYVYPLLKGFWYWILFGSNIFQTHIFHQLDFSWLQNATAEQVLRFVWTVIKYAMGVAGVALSFYVNYRLFKRYQPAFRVWKYKMQNPQDWLALYAITAFVATLLATAIAPTLPIYWHLLYSWPMTIIPLLLYLTEALQNPPIQRRARQYLMAVCLYFVMANLFGALGSKKHDIRQNFHEIYFKICKETCTLEPI